MSLLSAAELRAQLKTALPDAQLLAIADREEAAMIDICGPHYNAETPITETMPGGLKNLYFTRRLSEVKSVKENGVPLTAGSDYRVWASQGRIERLSSGYPGARWGDAVEVEYIPADDTPERKAALVELVRLALERTAMHSESIAGEYSYTAPEWELKRAQLLRRLNLLEV